MLPPSITTTSPLQLLTSICLPVTTTILCRPKVSYRPLVVISYLLQPKNSITTLKLLPLKAITILQQTYLPNPIDSIAKEKNQNKESNILYQLKRNYFHYIWKIKEKHNKKDITSWPSTIIHCLYFFFTQVQPFSTSHKLIFLKSHT